MTCSGKIKRLKKHHEKQIVDVNRKYSAWKRVTQESSNCDQESRNPDGPRAFIHCEPVCAAVAVTLPYSPDSWVFLNTQTTRELHRSHVLMQSFISHSHCHTRSSQLLESKAEKSRDSALESQSCPRICFVGCFAGKSSSWNSPGKGGLRCTANTNIRIKTRWKCCAWWFVRTTYTAIHSLRPLCASTGIGHETALDLHCFINIQLF